MFTNTPTQESASMVVETPPLRKFMFDRSFDGSISANAPERARGPVTLKPEQVDALKKDAYDIGFAAGQKAGVEEHDLYVRTALAHIDAQMNTLVEGLSAAQKDQEAQLRHTILAIARKLLPNLAERHGLEEVQAMLTDVIAEMVHEPRLVVRIHETDFDAINTKIHEITVQKAYAGKVVVLADAEIARGDCRVEWADGGIERNAKATWQAIEETIAPGNSPNETSPQETNHE